MSHLYSKNELNLDENVEKLIEDIETLETEVKKSLTCKILCWKEAQI